MMGGMINGIIFRGKEWGLTILVFGSVGSNIIRL